MVEEKKIPEKDKPFLLALISSGLTFACLFVTCYGAFVGNDSLRETGMEALKYTFSLTTMAWTFYFKK